MALVVVGYETKFHEALAMEPGDKLRIVKRRDDEWPGWVLCQAESGKQGWVPENSLKIDSENAVAQQTYTAREVSVMEGEIVRIEKSENGWAWVTNMTNETGWVPLRNLKLVE